MRLRKLGLLPSLAGSALLLWSALATALVKDRLDETYVVNEDAEISIENVNGSIEITAWDGDEVRVQAVKKAKNDDQLERVRIEIDASADRIHIETKIGKSGKFWDRNSGSGSVDYILSVPASVSLDDVSSVNGEVKIIGVTGNVSASTVNGGLYVEGLQGDAELETVNGSVEARFDRMGANQKVEAGSVNGGVRLYLPGDASARISADTVNGRLKNDFDIDVKKGKWVGADMKGTIGNGDAQVEASTVNGSVRVLRAD